MQRISVMMRPKVVLFFIILILTVNGTAFGAATIGMYYYPGWWPVTRWDRIKPYPEREPLLGWYDEGAVPTVNQQLAWMVDYGVGFVAFAWYWEADRIPKLQPETAIRAYLEADMRSRIPYALLWCNHNPSPESLEEWDEIIEYWLDQHLRNPEYLRIDGKPAVFIFAPGGTGADGRASGLREQAAAIGLTPHQMLERARTAARTKGLDGIYFILCIAAYQPWVNFAVDSGVDAITAYNYHIGTEGSAGTDTPFSRSFTELDAYYRMQWNWLLKNSPIPYFVPMTSGWDSRPWGGSSDPLHDNCAPTPQEFETHLRAGYDTIIRYAAQTKGICMLYAWNEYGEGGIIEPTKRHGFEFLQRVRKVFSK